jgi:hypothetical protein
MTRVGLVLCAVGGCQRVEMHARILIRGCLYEMLRVGGKRTIEKMKTSGEDDEGK